MRLFVSDVISDVISLKVGVRLFVSEQAPVGALAERLLPAGPSARARGAPPRHRPCLAVQRGALGLRELGADTAGAGCERRTRSRQCAVVRPPRQLCTNSNPNTNLTLYP